MDSYKYVELLSRIPIVITHIRGLITPLITSHEPPSRLGVDLNVWDLCLTILGLGLCFAKSTTESLGSTSSVYYYQNYDQPYY